MKVYFHKFYTEAHRRWQRGAELANALLAEGIEVSLVLDSSCTLALSGAFNVDNEFQAEIARHNEFLHESGKPPIEQVRLCWDLYPINTQGTRTGMTDDERVLWNRYVLNLMKTDLVIAPTRSAANRIRYTLNRVGGQVPRIEVAHPPCDPWWKEAEPREGEHVLDVMRPYDDWGRGKVKAACDALGIPCVESKGALSFDAFKQAVLGARLLVCAYNEASTGGLTLLEGYALGKPVLYSESRWNGAGELFCGRGNSFHRIDFEDLKAQIRSLWQGSGNRPEPIGAAIWVDAHYSDRPYARCLAELLGGL